MSEEERRLYTHYACFAHKMSVTDKEQYLNWTREDTKGVIEIAHGVVRIICLGGKVINSMIWYEKSLEILKNAVLELNLQLQVEGQCQEEGDWK